MEYSPEKESTAAADFLIVRDRPAVPTEYIFRRSFFAPSGARFSARLTADSRYILSINGRFVCDGPCRGAAHERFYETVELTPYLLAGDNEITVRVLYLPVDYMLLTTVFRHAAPALWWEGCLTLPDGRESMILSDETFTCERVEDARFFTVPPVFRCAPPAESRVFPQKTTPVRCEKGIRPTARSMNTGCRKYACRPARSL